MRCWFNINWNLLACILLGMWGIGACLATDVLAAEFDPLCGQLYKEPATTGKDANINALKSTFKQAQENFLKVCNKLQSVSVDGKKIDLTKHNADGIFGKLGVEEGYESYKKRHEQEIARLPEDLQKEFLDAQQAYRTAYSKLSTELTINNAKEPDDNSYLSGPKAPTFGNYLPRNEAKDEEIKNTYKEEHLEKEDLGRLEEQGLYKPTLKSNYACQIDKMKEKYQSKCYSCLVVKTLLEKFLNASTKAYELCRDAGVQVLLIGSMIWIAFFVLKNLASFTNIEPASMVNSLLVQFFKIMVAYVVIMSGADTFIWYVVNPLIAAGTDYGIGVLDASAGILNTQLSEAYTYKGVSSVSADILNNVLALTQGVDHVVSENLVIGHALTCHSTHAGAWVNETILNFRIIIPNIWIFICGLLIWFAGFMLVLGVCFYLLDITFKLGLAIMIFPVVMGLWPFSLTANKLSICIATILRSAAIFAFLAITTSFAMALISVSLRDVPELYERIVAGDAKWVSDTFDITGPYFIILVFAYLYSIKLVGETISSFVDKFFSGGIAAGASPMHSEMTRMTDISKKTALGVGAYGVAAAKYQGGRLLGGAAGMTIGKAAKFVKKQFNKPDEDKDSQRENATTQAGQATQAAGRATQAAGQATQAAGQATAATGRATAAAGRATSAGGRGVMRAGAALSKTGIGAIIGVPMMIAGAAMSAGGKAVEYTGKAVQKGGQAMQKAGKAMKKVGKKVEDAGKKMEKFGRKLDRGNESEPKEDNNTNASNEDGNEAQK